jgi:hypothetical protein
MYLKRKERKRGGEEVFARVRGNRRVIGAI